MDIVHKGGGGLTHSISFGVLTHSPFEYETTSPLYIKERHYMVLSDIWINLSFHPSPINCSRHRHENIVSVCQSSMECRQRAKIKEYQERWWDNYEGTPAYGLMVQWGFQPGQTLGLHGSKIQWKLNQAYLYPRIPNSKSQEITRRTTTNKPKAALHIVFDFVTLGAK